MKLFKITLIFLFFTYFTILNASEIKSDLPKKKIAYIVSDIKIPFWEIMSRGIKNNAEKLGYEAIIYSSNNLKKTEIENTIVSNKKPTFLIILILFYYNQFHLYDFCYAI